MRRELWNCFFDKPTIEAGSYLQNSRNILEIGLKSGKLAQLVAYFTSLPKKVAEFSKNICNSKQIWANLCQLSAKDQLFCVSPSRAVRPLRLLLLADAVAVAIGWREKIAWRARDAQEWGVCEIYGIYICKTWDRSHISKHRGNVSKNPKWPTTSLRGEGSADLGMLSKKVSFSCGSHLTEGKW